ncbi:MAG: hypothetical protein HY711_06840, partial [Candidatus Melainabacteria bacterium]|nr:hypothetical protein [Candidatus Melainabacteria bacterium]
QAAHPNTIDQGLHHTCNVTATEVLIYSRHPSDAAKLVVDVATTGEYIAPDGTKVKPDINSIRPDKEAQKDSPEGRDRSYATQQFNVVAVNLSYAKHNPNIHYENHPVSFNERDRDTGERLVDYSKNPHEVLKDSKGHPIMSPRLDASRIVEVHNTIIGGSDKDVFLGASEVIGPGRQGAANEATRFSSEKELTDKLAELNRDNKLPTIIMVHTAMEPFWKEDYDGAAGGSGGWHVVTITDYEPGRPAKVAVDNQWGENVDHVGENKVNIHDLFLATKGPERALQQMQQEVAWNKAHHQVDTHRTLELLRLRHVSGQLNDGDYVKKLGETIAAAKPTWERQRQAGTLNEESFARVQQEFEDAYQSVPPEGRLKLLRSAGTTGLMSEDHFNRSVGETMTALMQQRDQAQAGGKLEAFLQKKYNPALWDLDKLLAQLPSERQKAITHLIYEFSKGPVVLEPT